MGGNINLSVPYLNRYLFIFLFINVLIYLFIFLSIAYMYLLIFNRASWQDLPLHSSPEGPPSMSSFHKTLEILNTFRVKNFEFLLLLTHPINYVK